MLLGQNLRGVHHFGFYCIFIDKFFEISHRGSMSANPITPLTPPTVYINDEALKMKLSSVTISKKIEKRKKWNLSKTFHVDWSVAMTHKINVGRKKSCLLEFLF
jgi:hypothetical protein